MAVPFSAIGVIGVAGGIAGLVQAVSKSKQAFWDTPKVTHSDNPEEIFDNLNEAVQVLGSLRKDFEIEVEKNKMRVPSRTYMEWVHKEMEIEDRVKDLIPQYDNQGEEECMKALNSISPNGEFKRSIKCWQKGDFLGRGSFGTVYEGFTECKHYFGLARVDFLVFLVPYQLMPKILSTNACKLSQMIGLLLLNYWTIPL